MMRLSVLASVVLLTNVCHAVAVTSNGAGGGRWSEPETWAGKTVPGSDDSVTIMAGDVVTFDVDMSGWVTGIAGLTCQGIMNCSTSAGTYYLKTEAKIGGTGSINCGSPETAYPSNCMMTFDFDAKPSGFECGSGLALNLHCARPAYPMVALSMAAAAGQTELSVDTDVSGDIWAPGSTIRINDVSGDVPDSEECVIGEDGIASGTIAVAAGLANAKNPGAEVVLVTRNIRIVGSTQYGVGNATGGVLDCEISNCVAGVVSPSACTISGMISGCDQGVQWPYACTISGPISGCSYGVIYPSGCLISGPISGCYSGVTGGSGCMISSMVSGCSNGVFAGSHKIQDGAFSGNDYDLRRIVSASSYNTTFGGLVENYEYDTNRVPAWAYVASYDHNGVAGAFKAWTRGGVVVSDVDVAPAGYATSYWHKCTSSVTPCFRQELIAVDPGRTLDVRGQILIVDKQDLWPPRLELVDVWADPLVDASAVALASAVIPKPSGRYAWQDVTVRYTNTDAISKQIWIRCSAKQSGNDIYEVWTARVP